MSFRSARQRVRWRTLKRLLFAGATNSEIDRQPVVRRVSIREHPSRCARKLSQGVFTRGGRQHGPSGDDARTVASASVTVPGLCVPPHEPEPSGRRTDQRHVGAVSEGSFSASTSLTT